MALFRINYASRCTGRHMNLNVILPIEDSMMVDCTQAYPRPEAFQTLYLLHGYSGNENDWLLGTRIQELADYYRIAVVMPSGENSFYIDGKSKDAKYSTMIGQEIVEFTRNTFPLSRKREDTFIGGLSMGGFGALRVGSYYYETFSKIFIFSPAFILDNIVDAPKDYQDEMGDYYFYHHIFGNLKRVKDTEKDPFWCVERAHKAGRMPELFMTIGTEDFLYEANQMARKRLDDMGVEYTYHESPGVHSWDIWNKYLEPAIQWLTGKTRENTIGIMKVEK